MSTPGFWKPAPTATSSLQGQLREESRNDEDWAPVFSKSGAPLAQQRLLLPIYKHRRQIIYALEDFGVVIVVGETGSGKSTQIPQYLVESGWAENDFQIVCTQPRRIAAITLAQRVAEEAGTDLGNGVGYSVRFDDQSSPNTQIKYVTDGMLLREATVVDPLLSNYSVVMVDEAHERNLNSDAVLGLIKKIRRKRKDLRVIVCSATIDAQAFLDFFVGKTDETTTTNTKKRKSRWGRRVGENAESPAQPVKESPPTKGTIISVDGRQHSVDVLYFAQPASDYIHATVETAWKIYREDNSGDILCFLPSGEDIDRAIRIAEEQFQEHTQSVDFLPLYGTLPLHMQTRVFQRNENQKQATRRRIIFATNIAETSVTVPGITHVVDTGLVKLPYFDPKTGLDRLIVGPTSQASARQRAGRSGRVRSGKCYRLYTEQYLLKEMMAQTPPEILRTNLTSFILTLKALGVDNILAFDLMDVPSVDALSHGLESLYALGAIDDKTHLTKLGLDMSAFPTEPRVSRMLLESLDAGCSWEVLAVASALQVRDLFHRPRSRRPQQLMDYETAMSEIADTSGDHVTYANLMSEMDDRDMGQEECKEKFINYVALRRAMEVRKQLARFLRRFGRVEALGLVGAGDGLARSKAIRRCVTAGFFFNVAKLANDGRYYTLRKRILVTPATSSVFASHSMGSSEYIVFGETFDGPRGGIELRSVSAIDARWLRELAPHYWE
jgi:ATP-dependent RNA helicase DDX35